MSIRRPTLLAFTVAALALLAGAAPSQAVFIPGFTQYSATLDVAGRYVVTIHDNTTAECTPGQNITRTITVDLEMGRPRDVDVTITKQIAATSPARSSGAGEVSVKTETVEYSETNYCDGPPAPLVKPDCGEASGDIIASLGSLTSDAGSLPLSLSVARLNGGHLKFAAECPFPGLKINRDFGLSIFPAKASGMINPLGITSKALKNLKRGKALARRVSFVGPCKDIDYTTEKARVILPSLHSCNVDGHVWMRLKRVAS